MYQRNSFIQHVADVVSFDKSKIVSTKDGRKCIIHTDLVESYTKEPLMRCDRKMEKKCHKTFITFFTPNQVLQNNELLSVKAFISNTFMTLTVQKYLLRHGNNLLSFLVTIQIWQSMTDVVPV